MLLIPEMLEDWVLLKTEVLNQLSGNRLVEFQLFLAVGRPPNLRTGEVFDKYLLNGSKLAFVGPRWRTDETLLPIKSMFLD